MLDKLEKQVAFICEVDRLKSVIRRLTIIDGSRFENSAEHSWHVALMAMLLLEHSTDVNKLDMLKIVKMALLHDIVEIEAGDAFCYDEQEMQNQAEREQSAALNIFMKLPKEQGHDFLQLWQEFEGGQSPEALFARAIDRLHPFLLDYHSQGISWKAHGIKKSQVLKRMAELRENVPVLWRYFIQLLDRAISNGWIVDDDSEVTCSAKPERIAKLGNSMSSGTSASRIRIDSSRDMPGY